MFLSTVTNSSKFEPARVVDDNYLGRRDKIVDASHQGKQLAVRYAGPTHFDGSADLVARKMPFERGGNRLVKKQPHLPPS